MTKRTRVGVVARGAGVMLVVGVVLGLSACEHGILNVDESGIILPTDLDKAGPSAIPTLINGVVGRYHEAVSGLTLYSGLLTDEMILAGTFPTRFQVDWRRMLPSNGNLTDDLYVPLHQARFQADTVALQFQEHLADPDFADAELDLRQGIALARLYGGYTRLWLGELYCQSILSGVFPESAPVMPDDRIRDALAFLEEAEAAAEVSGLVAVQYAAMVGQARAHLWLGEYGEARDLAELVPRSFTYLAEYSNNDPDTYNAVYAFTWGDTRSIRWTVGDGTAGSSAREKWPFLEEFIALNLLANRPPGFTANSRAVPVVLQLLYSDPGSDILIASGVEARLIEAEVDVRNGQTAAAEDILNDLRSDYSLRVTLQWGVDPPAAPNLLPDLQLSGDLEIDLKTVSDERARELWLTGDRETTSRRLRRDPAVDIDLFPSKILIGGGDDIAFPMSQQELDNNVNLGSGDACPAGQAPGSWR